MIIFDAKLLAAPLTRISVHDISYTPMLEIGGRGLMVAGRGGAKFDERLNRISAEGRKTLFNASVILAKS